MNGAQERTRTSTTVRPLAPEASASASSATWAQGQSNQANTILRRAAGFVNEAESRVRLPVRGKGELSACDFSDSRPDESRKSPFRCIRARYTVSQPGAFDGNAAQGTGQANGGPGNNGNARSFPRAASRSGLLPGLRPISTGRIQ